MKNLIFLLLFGLILLSFPDAFSQQTIGDIVLPKLERELQDTANNIPGKAVILVYSDTHWSGIASGDDLGMSSKEGSGDARFAVSCEAGFAALAQGNMQKGTERGYLAVAIIQYGKLLSIESTNAAFGLANAAAECIPMPKPAPVQDPITVSPPPTEKSMPPASERQQGGDLGQMLPPEKIGVLSQRTVGNVVLPKLERDLQDTANNIPGKAVILVYSDTHWSGIASGDDLGMSSKEGSGDARFAVSCEAGFSALAQGNMQKGTERGYLAVAIIQYGELLAIESTDAAFGIAHAVAECLPVPKPAPVQDLITVNPPPTEKSMPPAGKQQQDAVVAKIGRDLQDTANNIPGKAVILVYSDTHWSGIASGDDLGMSSKEGSGDARFAVSCEAGFAALAQGNMQKGTERGYLTVVIIQYGELLAIESTDAAFGIAHAAAECIPMPKPAPERGGGCLVATAAHGSEMALQVQQLRELRDNRLLQTESGRMFMESFNGFYYSFSPAVADYEMKNPMFRELVRITITPMISSLSLLDRVDMDSEAQVLGYGIGLILLNAGVYVVAPAVAIKKLYKPLSSNKRLHFS